MYLSSSWILVKTVKKFIIIPHSLILATIKMSVEYFYSVIGQWLRFTHCATVIRLKGATCMLTLYTKCNNKIFIVFNIISVSLFFDRSWSRFSSVVILATKTQVHWVWWIGFDREMLLNVVCWIKWKCAKIREKTKANE